MNYPDDGFPDPADPNDPWFGVIDAIKSDRLDEWWESKPTEKEAPHA